jgi:outer membrane biogenesis lipoprotein LolB
MQKLISILLAVSLAILFTACSSDTQKAGNSVGDQRSNAEKAQRELSSEVKK